MEKQEMNNRKEACNMALLALTIPLSIIALAIAKAKTKINIINVTEAESKTTDNIDDMDKPKSSEQIESERRAVYCFGTMRLLEKKRKTLRFFNKTNKFIGLSIPICLSLSLVSAKDLPIISTIMPIFPYITFILNIYILVISVWALIAEWDAKIENYTDSISNNMQYYKIFKEIAERYNENPTEYAAKFKETILLDDTQRKQDGRGDFSPKDHRFITRQGSHQLQFKCVDCNKIPDIKNPGTCRNCGK
ncbi:MAG: hypothetical protein LBC64_04625 [Fibromonadaceae bacterium]|jgi:mobilome CxxCx(11)CxxC protein|nr:hypothetical protein [Fibromonadaceae bacterium]